MMLLFGVVIACVVGVFLLTALTGAPYVPSQRKELDELFGRLRPLDAHDTLLDIGSGDGAVLLAAVQHGAQAVGYELNPFLVWVARVRLRRAGAKATVELRNLWTASFPDAVTVVYTFGESRDIAKMYRKVQQEATRLNRPLELLSYGFAVPGVKPQAQHRAHYLYKVSPLHPEEA